MYKVAAGNVSTEDFLTSRPGGMVRVDGDPRENILPLPQQPLPP